MGLIVSIYRDGYDSTSNHFHGKAAVTVVNVSGPFEPDEDRPAALLIDGPRANDRCPANPIVVPAVKARYAVGATDNSTASVRYFATMDEVERYQETLDQEVLASGGYFLDDLDQGEEDDPPTYMPLERRDVIGPMNGGTFASTSDSRWSEAAGTYGAVPIHDRFESQETYDRSLD